jgi:hypothetical protein
VSNITKNHKVGIFAVFIASALMLGTISVSGFDTALATKDKDKDKNDYKSQSNYNKQSNNDGEQEIDQTQVSKQSSECRDSGAVVVSALNCNNVALQLNLNTGSNAIGQQ